MKDKNVNKSYIVESKKKAFCCESKNITDKIEKEENCKEKESKEKDFLSVNKRDQFKKHGNNSEIFINQMNPLLETTEKYNIFILADKKFKEFYAENLY